MNNSNNIHTILIINHSVSMCNTRCPPASPLFVVVETTTLMEAFTVIPLFPSTCSSINMMPTFPGWVTVI